MMNRIQIYILKQFLQSIGIVAIIVIGATILVDVVEILRSVGSDVKLSLGQAMQLSLLKLPMLLEQTLPFVLFAGSILCFSKLNNRSELAIIRSVGISAWHFIMPAVLVSLTLGITATTLINPIGARAQVDFNQQRANLLGQDIGVNAGHSGIWLKQTSDVSQMFINAGKVENNGLSFANVRMIIQEPEFSDTGEETGLFKFSRRLDAARANIHDGFWQLTNVVEYTLDAPAQNFDTIAIPSTIEPSQFLQNFASPVTIGFWQLPSFIAQTKSAGLNALKYQGRYYGLLTLPLMYVIMTLLGVLACLRIPRSSGAGLYIGACVGVTFGYYFFYQFSNALGESGAVPLPVAAWTSSLMVLLLVGWYLANTEDG